MRVDHDWFQHWLVLHNLTNVASCNFLQSVSYRSGMKEDRVSWCTLHMLPHGHILASPRDSGLDKCYIEASCYLQRHQKIAGHWLRRAAIWLRRLRFEVAFMRSQSSFLPWRCLRSLIREGRGNVVVAGRSFLDAQPVPCRTMEEATTSPKNSSFCSSRGACSSSSSCRVASALFLL